MVKHNSQLYFELIKHMWGCNIIIVTTNTLGFDSHYKLELNETSKGLP